MKGILKHKAFLKLYVASIISRFGDSVDMIAFGYLVYQLTGSKMLLASIYIVNVMPNILFSTFAGAFADFYSKKKIIVIGDALRGTVVLIVAYLFYANALSTWHLFAMTFINSTIEAFVAPCKYATIPKLVDEAYYLQINSTLQSVQGVVELLGVAIAGFVIASMGIEGAMVIDAVTFLLSGLIILTVKFPKEAPKPLSGASFMAAYVDGIKYAFGHKAILGLLISGALINFFLTPFNALLPAYIQDILNMGPEGISIMSVCLGVGGILGGILAGVIGKRLGAKGLIFLGLFLLGIFYTVLGLPQYIDFFDSIVVISIDFLLLAAMASVAGAGIKTYLMSAIDKDQLARVGGIMSMFMMCATPLGAFLAGILVTAIPLSLMIVVFGGMILLSTLIPVITLKDV